ncbi:MAG: hypothetical protein H0U71_04840 [Gammaproteobacteria bacterium]|nr:hypothetical protein [Gammaproteobacteria bacterium]
MQKADNSIHDLIKKVCSGVIHIEFWVEENRKASASAFVSNGCLITDNNVLKDAPADSIVTLAYQANIESPDRKEIKKFPLELFHKSLRYGSDPQNYDYAILEMI